MERLTEWGTRGVAFIKKLRPCGIPNDCNDIIYEVTKRCAAYEDTGLMPGEIEELLHDGTGPLHKKLGQWIDAERDGRLVTLPCKIGSRVYVVSDKAVFESTVLSITYETISTEINVSQFRLLVQCDEPDCRSSYCISVWEQDVFLTRAEAEAALKGGAYAD